MKKKKDSIKSQHSDLAERFAAYKKKQKTEPKSLSEKFAAKKVAAMKEAEKPKKGFFSFFRKKPTAKDVPEKKAKQDQQTSPEKQSKPDSEKPVAKQPHEQSDKEILAKLKKDERIYLNLSVSEKAISSILVRNSEGQQTPIYSVSRVL